MPKIIIYSKNYCPYCVYAKEFFDNLKLPYEIIDVTNDVQMAQKMIDLTQCKTVPQIFINGQHIGGFTDLVEMHKQGKLIPILENKNDK